MCLAFVRNFVNFSGFSFVHFELKLFQTIRFICHLFSLFLITAVLCGTAAGVLTLLSWRSCRSTLLVLLCVWGAAKKR